MHLEDFGYSPYFEQQRAELKLSHFEIGRVIAEHKERYTVLTKHGEYDAEITGTLRFAASSRVDYPAVGDWVALTLYDSGISIIHGILPRQSTISRQAVGQFAEIQIIAANVDYALIVQAVDRDFNLNRLERYLTICYSAKIKPIIVLTKSDLISPETLAEFIDKTHQRLGAIPVVAISSETQNGYDSLVAHFEPGKAYCMLGSSGVGKSTLLNKLAGVALMKTAAISTSTSKGRHATSHRELVRLSNGAILIDNPGMREVGVIDSNDGVEKTFDKIFHHAKACKFKDCTHTSEIGCAVLEAIANGEIEKSAYESFLKVERENAHFLSSTLEKRKKDKDFGKMVKNYNKHIRLGEHGKAT